jgi:tetratricopeptide (TPR) repeat protein
MNRFKCFSLLVALALWESGCVGVSYEPDYEPDASVTKRMTPQDARRILASFETRMGFRVSRYNEEQRSVPISLVHVGPTGASLILVDGVHKKAYAYPLKDLKVAAGIRDQYGQVRSPVVFLNDKVFLNAARAREFADAIFVVQQAAARGEAAQEEINFQKAAKAYLEATSKPALSEQVRELKIQAESALREKHFSGTARYYMQALEIAPWWPDGHFNLALVLSELGDFDTAIVEMKRYLLLVPDAANARAAQDTIYEWKRKAQ